MNNKLYILTSKRLLLREFTDNDLENVFDGLSNPEVIKYYGISFKTLEETKEQLHWFNNLKKTETGIWWAICCKKTNTFYGAIGFNDLDKKDQKAEIGFWLLPEFWKKGIISECMPLVINPSSNQLRLKKIEAFVDSENIACKKLLLKHNFILEKTLENYEIKNEKSIDLDIFTFFQKNKNKGVGYSFN